MSWWKVLWILILLFILFMTASSLIQQWYDFHMGELILIRTDNSETNWKQGKLTLINNQGLQVNDYFIPWEHILYVRRLDN